MQRYLPFLILSLLLGVTLGGCGIKPDRLTPPATEKPDKFPRTYPDSKTLDQ